MALFVYQARNLAGQKISAVLEAENAERLTAQLIQQGYFVSHVAPLEKNRFAGFRWINLVSFRSLWSKQKLKQADLMVLTRQFATLLQAGIPLNRILSVLEGQHSNPVVKRVLRQIQMDVNQGLTLYGSLEKHSGIFDSLYSEIVKMGEIGGLLEQAFNDLAQIIEKRLQLRKKITHALLYPAILFGVSLLVISYLVCVILPEFTLTLQQMGGKIPLPTHLLLTLGNGLQNHVGIIGILALGIFLLLNLGFKGKKGRLQRDRLCLKIPVYGKLKLRSITARITGILAALVNSGVPIVQAMEIVEGTVENRYISKALDQARLEIVKGSSIADSLAQANIFEALVFQLVQVGEESGDLVTMLKQAAEYAEAEVSNTLEALIPLIEPVLIIFIAFLVGFIILSMVLPMFEIMYTVDF